MYRMGWCENKLSHKTFWQGMEAGVLGRVFHLVLGMKVSAKIRMMATVTKKYVTNIKHFHRSLFLSALFLVWFCPALMCFSFKGQIMLNLHLYRRNHHKFEQLEMSSYQSGFCFEESFSQKCLNFPWDYFLSSNLSIPTKKRG